MTIMIMERVSPSLRGHLSKWLIEVKAGVFVGRISALVRDLLWQHCQREIGDGLLMQIWRTNNEQGFDLRYENCKDYVPVDMEGVWLIMHPNDVE